MALVHFDDHFSPYLPCFQRRTRSVEDAAKRYLHGLFQCYRRNMEQMAEQLAGSHYQRLHHMLSESNWSRAEVRQQLIGDANAHFGYGVAPQWNGRLCKTENSQVGVFAALMRDRACALVDGELLCPSIGLMTRNAARRQASRKRWSSEPRVKCSGFVVAFAARRTALQPCRVRCRLRPFALAVERSG